MIWVEQMLKLFQENTRKSENPNTFRYFLCGVNNKCIFVRRK